MANFITGNKTVYFVLVASTSTDYANAFSVKLGPMTGPLREDIVDVKSSYVKQSNVYRLNADGVPEKLWGYMTGYTKKEYDPKYIEYLTLKNRFEDA